MQPLHSINREQRLYVMRSGSGFSCLGFDVAEKRRRALWAWVGQESPEIRKGSKKHFADYSAAMAAASRYSDSLKARGARDWRCPIELTPALVGLEGRRVAVIQDGEEISRFWVGKSTGWMPIHLEIKRRNSMGGCGAWVPEGATVRVVS